MKKKKSKKVKKIYLKNTIKIKMPKRWAKLSSV